MERKYETKPKLINLRATPALHSLLKQFTTHKQRASDMERKNETKSKLINFRVTPEYHRLLKQYAARKHTSMTSIIESWIEQFIARP